MVGQELTKLEVKKMPLLKDLERQLKVTKKKESKTFYDLDKDRKIKWLSRVIAEKRQEKEINRTNLMVAILRGKMRREDGIGINDPSYWGNVLDLVYFHKGTVYEPTEETDRLFELVSENENFVRAYEGDLVPS